MEVEQIQDIENLIAPKILGNLFAKKILALQMFSNPMQEGELMHSLLVGDVASGKSMLGDDVSQMVPLSAFGSRKVTPSGMLENVISCNGGIYIQDELDKIDTTTREMLLEVMQFGRVTSDKFRFHQKIDAHCNIIALCNPRGYTLIKGISIINQLNFTPALLSRFHLIVPFYPVDPDLYGEIARGYIRHENSNLRRRKIKEYIMNVRQQVPMVEISESLADKIGGFVRMLKIMSAEKEIITPRLVEGTISMVRASARMNLRFQANQKDYEYVRGILEKVYIW